MRLEPNLTYLQYTYFRFVFLSGVGQVFSKVSGTSHFPENIPNRVGSTIGWP